MNILAVRAELNWREHTNRAYGAPGYHRQCNSIGEKGSVPSGCKHGMLAPKGGQSRA